MNPSAFWSGAAIISLLGSISFLGAQELESAELPNLDQRRLASMNGVELSSQQAAARDSLMRRIPSIRIDWHSLLASPRFIFNDDGFLTGPDSEEEMINPKPFATLTTQSGEPKAPSHRIKRFLDDNSALFGGSM